MVRSPQCIDFDMICRINRWYSLSIGVPSVSCCLQNHVSSPIWVCSSSATHIAFRAISVSLSISLSLSLYIYISLSLIPPLSCLQWKACSIVLCFMCSSSWLEWTSYVALLGSWTGDNSSCCNLYMSHWHYFAVGVNMFKTCVSLHKSCELDPIQQSLANASCSWR